MKSNNNENRNRLARKLLLLGGVLIVAATASGMMIYSNSLREIESRAQDSMVLDRLVEATKFNLLIQQLNKSKAPEARQFLKIALADDLREADRLAANANPETVAELAFTMAEIARAERAHPEYYAVKQPVHSARVVQIVRHEVKQ